MSPSTSCKAAIGALALAVTAMALAPVAVADPIIPQAGSEPADATISDLQRAGFDVRINYGSGSPNVPLSECKVTDINNPNGAMASMVTLSTVYVGISCANAK